MATAADTLSEGDETFQVQIAADSGNPLPSNVTIHPTGNTATATITDDAADAMTATVAGSAATVAEGSNAVFTVTLSAARAPRGGGELRDLGKRDAGDGLHRAFGVADHRGGAATGTITVATAAESPALLEPNEDTLVDPDRVERRRRLVEPGRREERRDHDHRQRDGDGGLLGGLGERREGRTARLTVSLSGTVSDDVTVKWKTADATAGSADYTAQAATAVTIAAGATAATVTVQTAQDLLAEGGETFTASRRPIRTIPCRPGCRWAPRARR